MNALLPTCRHRVFRHNALVRSSSTSHSPVNVLSEFRAVIVASRDTGANVCICCITWRRRSKGSSRATDPEGPDTSCIRKVIKYLDPVGTDPFE